MTKDVETVSAPEGRIARPGHRRRRILLVATGLVLLLGAAAGGIGLRLVGGPIWTERGTASVAARIADAAGPGSEASVGVAGLSIGPDLAPVVHFRDIHVSVPGEGTFSVDTVEIGTEWATLLGSGTRLSRVVADHVYAEVEASDRPVPAVATLLAGLDGMVERTGIGFVDVGALTLARRRDDGPALTVFDGVAVSAVTEGEDRLSAQIAGEGVVGPWSISAAIGPGEEPGRRRIALSSKGIDASDLAAMAGDDAPAVTGPVGGTAEFLVGPDGALAGGRGDVTLGPLRPVTGADDTDFTGRSRLSFAWDAAEARILIEPSPVELPIGRAMLQGEVRPPAGGETRWRFALRAKETQTGPDDDGPALGGLAGSYDPAAHLLTLDRIEASAEGARFAAAMRFSHEGGNLVGALSGVFPSMSTDALKDIWPPMVASEARRWVGEMVHSGRIEDAAVDLTFTGSGLDAVADSAAAALAFKFDGLAFRPFDDGPMITQAKGTGRLTGKRFEIAMEAGTVDLEDGRTMKLGPSTFVVPSITTEPPTGEIALTLSGDASSAFGLWTRIPLAEGLKLPARPEAVSGRASGDIRLTLPLIRDVPQEAVAYDGRIRFENLDFADKVEGRSVKDAAVDIRIAEGLATIEGTASVDGVDADIELSRSLSGGESGGSAIRLVLSDADRKSLGFDLGDALKGPVSVAVETRRGADGAEMRTVKVDLAKAAVDFGAIGLAKAKGKPGTATFTLSESRDRVAADDISVTMGTVSLSGSLLLGKGGRIVSGSFPKVKLASGDDLSVKLSRGEGDVLKVTARGDRFDARKLVTRLRKQSDPQAPAADSIAIEVDAAIGKLTGHGDESLTGVNLAARIDDGRLSALSLAAQTAGGGAASATLTPAGNLRRVQVEAGEVGRLLRFLDVYSRIVGGRATVVGTIDAAGVVRTAVEGSRWRIVDEPALARISTAADEGATAGYSTADIDRLMFELTFGNGLLRIDDGVVRASTAGISIQGDVDFRRDRLRLSGSYLPASAFDSLLGKIPLLGQTVFAGGRAGLIGVSFRITGPIGDPTMSVNPLSVIAPGIFRKLFEMR